MAEELDQLTVARVEALFVSDLSASSDPGRADVTAAISRAVRTFGGVRGCVAELAAAYGEHPETAVPRLRWATRVVRVVYPPRPGRRRLAA